jgi:hypothetical protein
MSPSDWPSRATLRRVVIGGERYDRRIPLSPAPLSSHLLVPAQTIGPIRAASCSRGIERQTRRLGASPDARRTRSGAVYLRRLIFSRRRCDRHGHLRDHVNVEDTA